MLFRTMETGGRQGAAVPRRLTPRNTALGWSPTGLRDTINSRLARGEDGNGPNGNTGRLCRRQAAISYRETGLAIGRRGRTGLLPALQLFQATAQPSQFFRVRLLQPP